ncbi:MAG: 16S rRNA (uracil(1498)-N(3))-methyltransferase [Gammaproteobacteria bacterium]|nr:16S rRNA (uracil(1498)-N(3))-methyltransferase [Gammaproteobacteria bacterium]
MRLTRVFVDAPLGPGEHVTLSGGAGTHLARVLRLRPGDACVLFNGRGGEYSAVIDGIRGASVLAVVGAHCDAERESPLALTLAQGVSRGERMDLVVQKATELGVTRIAPLLCERSVVRLDEQQARRRREHWQAIAIGACEQSGRNRVPEVLAPMPLPEFLRESSDDASPSGAAGALRIVLSPAGTTRLPALPRPAPAVTVLIGPEGGLAESEHQSAAAAGFLALRMGPRILRTETAAIAALALLQRELGDLS